VLAALFLFVIVFNANGMRIALTTARSLNVRDTPNGDVIDALPLGSAVEIANSKGGWANVVYFKNGSTSSPKYGWVSIIHLEIMSVGGISSSSGTCETEYQSGAEVCLEISDAELKCNESYTGDYYRDCEVEIDYELTTDYRGQSSISVDIECEAEISFKARQSYNSSESDDESESHTLDANDSDYGSVDIEFSFSSYKEVYKVELESVECEIEDMNLW
jgi:hypothetical protein